MVIFKCPYCRTEYEMTMARLSSKQRSYAKCQVCHQTMYSWNSRNVPIFTLMNASNGKTSAIQPSLKFEIDAPLARPSGRELSQELSEGLFSRPVSGLNGFIKNR